LRDVLSKLLDTGGNHLLAAPRESDAGILWGGGLSCSWLNASDVARYFRIMGMDFDGSQSFATLNMHPEFLPTKLPNHDGLPETRHSFRYNDNVMEPHYQHQPQDLAYLYNNPTLNFLAATQDISGFGPFISNSSYNARSHGYLRISIDVSRLIHREYISFLDYIDYVLILL